MSKEEYFYLDVDEIIPDPEQPRQTFSEDDVNNLALTMLRQGQINPLEVDGNNVLVTGEIRWRAIKRNVEVYPNKPELRQVNCTRWSGTPENRFERQVIENLHHHSLTDGDRDQAVVKLWESGGYPNQEQLGRALGLSQKSISDILVSSKFREDTEGLVADGVSNRAILDTEGLEEDDRVKILKAVSEDKILAKDIRGIRKVAQTSNALLDKAIEGTISVERAIEAADTIQEIEDTGVQLTIDQKQTLANNVERDQDIIKKYKGDVLDKVKRIMTATPDERERVYEPIGRTSPVNYIINVKDEIKDTFRRHIGNCDMTERTWARRILVEIRDEVDELLTLITDD